MKLIAELMEMDDGTVVENKKQRYFAIGKAGEPRTQDRMLEIAEMIQQCTERGELKAAEEIKRENGVNGPPGFTQLVYSNATRDCPAEMLHLLYQGVEKAVQCMPQNVLNSLFG